MLNTTYPFPTSGARSVTTRKLAIQTYSDFTSCSCVCVSVFGFMQFSFTCGFWSLPPQSWWRAAPLGCVLLQHSTLPLLTLLLLIPLRIAGNHTSLSLSLIVPFQEHFMNGAVQRVTFRTRLCTRPRPLEVWPSWTFTRGVLFWWAVSETWLWAVPPWTNTCSF